MFILQQKYEVRTWFLSSFGSFTYKGQRTLFRSDTVTVALWIYHVILLCTTSNDLTLIKFARAVYKGWIVRLSLFVQMYTRRFFAYLRTP